MVGAQNVPSEIVKQIEAADICVCDITTVTKFKGKSIPNPNVTFELGFSVAHLGWARNILLFNEEIATFENLPFDFDRQRISKYKMPDDKGLIKLREGNLRGLMRVAIEHIILDAPKRPSELKNKTAAEIKRERDLVNIKWYLRQISIAYLDMHIRDMPEMLHYFAGFMHDGLDSVVRRSEFKLYDTELQKVMLKVYKHLGQTLAYDRFYQSMRNDWIQSFGLRHKNRDLEDIQGEQKAAREITVAIQKLDKAVRSLVDRIRSDYIEVDLDDTNALFAKAYTNEVSGQ